MSLPDNPAPPPLPRKPPNLRRLQVPSSPRGAEAWRADAQQVRLAVPDVDDTVAPPPLPPKPAFARAPDVNSHPSHPPELPPPLPPKPEFARAEPKPQLPPRPHALLSDARVPDRPLPPLPISPLPIPHVDVYGLDRAAGSVSPKEVADGESSRGDDGMDELGDVTFPERSIISDALTVSPQPRPFQLDNLSESLSDPAEIPDDLEIPVAPPACALCHASLPRVFGRPPLTTQDIFSLLPHNEHDVRSAAVEIAHKRARSRGRIRRNKVDAISTSLCDERVICRTFEPELPGPEFSLVLDEVLRSRPQRETNGHHVISAHCTRAMQLLVGYIIKAVLYSAEDGRALFADTLRYIGESDDAIIRGLAFTLLINVVAQGSFIRPKNSGVVEEISARLFADVVLVMLDKEKSSEVWDKAVRCALLLFASENIIPTATQRKALLALAANLGPDQHPDVTRLLFEHAEREVSTGVSATDVNTSGNGNDIKSLPQYYDSIEETLRLYTETSSLSTRRNLFRAILQSAVDRVVDIHPSPPLPEVIAEQTQWLQAVLEAHDAGVAFALEFRQGCGPDFVISLVRQILFTPLFKRTHDDLPDFPMISEDDDADVCSRWGRAAMPASPDPDDQDPRERAFALSSRRHARAIRTANKLLDKNFVLRVLKQIEEMAHAHAEARNASLATSRSDTWPVLRDAERAALALRWCGRESVACRAALKQLRDLHAAVSALAGMPPQPRAATHLAELVLESFLLSPAFSPMAGAGAGDSVAAQFLSGQRFAIRDMLSEAHAGLFLGLLQLTKRHWHLRYVSELRQCLVELVGAVPERGGLLASFKDDPDTAVAYRAEVVYSNFAESSSSSNSPPPKETARQMLRRPQVEHPSPATDNAYSKAQLYKSVSIPAQPKFN